MKNLVLAWGFYLVFAATSQAGSVITVANGPEVSGKLTLDAAAVHVEGSPASEINLANILVADFSDAPFHLDYFSSVGDTATQLPAGWKGQDIGPANAPGSVSYASGAFTLTGNQWDPTDDKDQTDHYFLTGLPWTGDGQWTVRVKSIDASNAILQGGFMLRESLDPFSAMIGTAASNADLATMFVRYHNHGTWSNSSPTNDPPVWFRISRRGPSVDFELSADGVKWSLVGQSTPRFTENIWAGFFINSHRGQADQKVVLDQVLFTPASGPAPSRIVPTGVLLRSGSFLAGYFDPLDFGDPVPVGKFTRNGNDLSISAAKVAAVVYHPVKRSQLTEVESQVGVILQNDDFITGDFKSINADGVHLASIQLGDLPYTLDQISACNLNSMQPQPANYEIRLKDGSNIRAKDITASNGQFSIEEVSGISVTVAPDEIAQFRAGSSRVQTLLDLAWKATSAGNPNPAPECWTGNNQEQIMVASAGTTIDFPLAGKFHALALRIAMSPDSPPGSQAVVHILADGKEIARSPALKAGDQPRLLQVALSNPKKVTLMADSVVPGAKVLFIDPVAILESSK